jgi:adenylate cyclase
VTVQAQSEEWRTILTDGHAATVRARRLFRMLPSAPRCKVCNSPFGGVGGRIVGLAGFRPSRKNPTLCTRCCDVLPVGGAEVDVAVLFADVRGSTSLGEGVAPAQFAELLNRFYAVATDTLVQRDAVVDKLIGDEVMALFVPGIAGSEYRGLAVESGLALLRAVGYGTPEGAWLNVGAAVNVGIAYVGNVGDAVVDFTALGDTVNTGARMQGEATAGELLVRDELPVANFPELRESRTLELRGRSESIGVNVLSP